MHVKITQLFAKLYVSVCVCVWGEKKKTVTVDARSGLGVPQDFTGMVSLSGGGHIYATNVPPQESK